MNYIERERSDVSSVTSGWRMVRSQRIGYGGDRGLKRVAMWNPPVFCGFGTAHTFLVPIVTCPL